MTGDRMDALTRDMLPIAQRLRADGWSPREVAMFLLLLERTTSPITSHDADLVDAQKAVDRVRMLADDIQFMPAPLVAFRA